MSNIYNRLSLPFAESDIEWVVTYTYGDNYNDVIIGVAPYIRRESIITRLDVVCGPSGWRNVLQPLDFNGLYQGIVIIEKLNESTYREVTKWDGSAINSSDSKDRIDPIKSVATNSFRRAAELWGLGRYLKELPQMYAVKRPKDDYDAAEFTKVNRKGQASFKVRWDHPQIPKEFLPDYMTPEQYIQLKGISKYCSESSRKMIDSQIQKWDNDHQDVPYTHAVELIAQVRAQIQEGVPGYKAKEITMRGNAPDPRQKPKPPQKSTKPKSSKQDTAYNKMFTEMRRLTKYCLTNDPAGKWSDTEYLTKLQGQIDRAIETATPIDTGKVERYIQILTDFSNAIKQEKGVFE